MSYGRMLSAFRLLVKAVQAEGLKLSMRRQGPWSRGR